MTSWKSLGNSGLLLDSLYVAVASPAGIGSSVLLFHVGPPPRCALNLDQLVCIYLVLMGIAVYL